MVRELTIAEMEIVSGAADNKPVSSKDFKSGLIGWAVSEGMNMTQNQINNYVSAYNTHGISGVIAASPGFQMFSFTSALISGLSSKDGNNYCNDGSNYGQTGGNY